MPRREELAAEVAALLPRCRRDFGTLTVCGSYRRIEMVFEDDGSVTVFGPFFRASETFTAPAADIAAHALAVVNSAEAASFPGAQEFRAL